MNTSEEYFTRKLYPFQDGILSIVKKSGTPFYLTGGIALSRRWSAHRYSEDLDQFVDADPRYSAHVDALFLSLKDASRPSVDMNLIHNNALTLIGTTTFAPCHQAEAVRLVASGAFPAEKLVSHRYPLSRFTEGAGLALAGKALKCVFFPEGSI